MPKSKVTKSRASGITPGLLRLAENPFAEDEMVDDGDIDDQAMGDDGDMDYDDEEEGYPEDEEYEDEDEEEPMMQPHEESQAYMSMARKGRRVVGPRTKLSKQIGNQMQTLAKGLVDTQEMQQTIAKALTTLSRSQAVLLSKMDDFESDFRPYGDEEGDGEEFHEDDEEGTMNEPGLSMARKSRSVRKSAPASRVAKDDAASSYGEKDDDIVGNRSWVPDEKDKDAELSLIQGGPGDGPGPVSKSAQDAASIVLSELRKAGVLPSTVKKARSPQVANSTTLNKADDDDMAYITVVKAGFPVQIPVMKRMIAKSEDGRPLMSELDINHVRESIGDLPSGGIF